MKLSKSKLYYQHYITTNCTYSFVGKSLLTIKNTFLHKNLSLPQSNLEWIFLHNTPLLLLTYSWFIHQMCTAPVSLFIIGALYPLVCFLLVHCTRWFIYHWCIVPVGLFLIDALYPLVCFLLIHCTRWFVYHDFTATNPLMRYTATLIASSYWFHCNS